MTSLKKTSATNATKSALPFSQPLNTQPTSLAKRLLAGSLKGFQGSSVVSSIERLRDGRQQGRIESQRLLTLPNIIEPCASYGYQNGIQPDAQS